MNTTQRYIGMALVALTASATTACGMFESKPDQPSTPGVARQNSTTELASSSRVPGAQGEIRVKDAGNNNTGVQVRVKHLATPAKIESTATTFMVWAKPLSELGRVQPLGALTVNKDLTGELDATTPLRNFEVFVTAESSSQLQDPRGERLLWATVSQN